MKKMLVLVGILSLLVAGSAEASWTSLATNINTGYNVWHTGYTGTFYYNDANGFGQKSASLASFTLSIDQNTYPGTAWLTDSRYYCVDLSEWVAPSYRDYYLTDDNDGIQSIQGTVAGNRRAAWILHNWNHVTDSAQRAGLQLAIWEAVYDNGSFDLYHGNFKIVGGTNSTIRGWAATFYGGSTADGIGIYADDDQNLMGSVPEPGTVVLIGLALLASGATFLRRRRA